MRWNSSGKCVARSGRWSVAGGRSLLPATHYPLPAVRRGVTLVELLVVVSIVMVLAATMLPGMRPAIEERRIREAARSLSTYISAARNRAIETGRPCGIAFQKYDAAIPGAMTVDRFEVLPPFNPRLKVLPMPQKSRAASLELPAGVVIDLEASGTDTLFPQFSTATGPITIIFAPNGSLDTIYVNNQPYPAIERVYLLVGRRDRIPAAQAADGITNLLDGKNLWVTVSPQTGLIVTANNVANANLDLARDQAKKAQTLGGK